MHYSFTNSENLQNFLTSKCFDELEKEFSKTKVHLVREGWGALIQYRAICDAYYHVKRTMPDSMSSHAVELFTEMWNIEALTMIKSSRGRWGVLSEKASKVLAEYDKNKAKAIDMYVKIKEREFFEETVTDTFDNVPITIKCVYGRLSLFREGTEYVIFYSED